MLAVEHEVLVHLVGDREQVVLDAQACDSSSSARPNTLPVGLCGELSSTRRVRGVTAAASASASKWKSGVRSCTTRRCAPAIAMHAA